MNLNNLKKTVGVLALSSTLLLSACGKKGPEGVATIVNGTEISTERFIQEYAATRNKYVSMSGSEDILTQTSPQEPTKTIDELVKETALKNLQQIELVKQDAEKAGLKSDPAEVENHIKKIIEQSGGEENFKKQLATMGQTPEFYKSYLENLQLIQKYTQKKMEDLKPTDEEVQKYYDEHKKDFITATASHILVKDDAEAKEIKKQLNDGGDFAAIAKEKSQDTQSGKQGGSLGEFGLGQMVEEFSGAIANMEEGTISDPVKTKFGYHIIKLDKKVQKSLEDSKQEVTEKLSSEKFTQYIDKLTKDAKIESYVDLKEEIQLPEEMKIKLPDKNAKEQQAPEQGEQSTKPAEEKSTEKTNEKAAEKTNEKSDSKNK